MTTETLDVLVVDDEAPNRAFLRTILTGEHGHRVVEAANANEALKRIEEQRFDAVLLDIRMPGPSGLDALVTIQSIAPDTAVIMVSGEASFRNAQLAMRRGAFDFIEKPVDGEYLIGTLDEAVRVTRARRRSPDGASPPEAPAASARGRGAAEFGIVGRSPAVQALVESVRRIAPSQGRVLITGENGAGKELVAEAIHTLSKRAAGPFVKLNCAAIPKDLVESEIFGHERGAFTGATQSKKGRMELAHEGTLFLDEIGDLSHESQAKLLRAIETGEIERVGGTKTLVVDVRIVAATNRDLKAAIEAGDFRDDLFYRLNVVPIHVPPLRERGHDVQLLADHFLARFCEAEGHAPKRLTAEAREVLEAYHWPGNVRELRNLMERAAILVAADEIGPGDLSPWLEQAPDGETGQGLKSKIERREADEIRRALEQAKGNVTQAAAGLGIDRTNLHRKMRRYGIERR
jgi:two-component system nitrogen regulation response regulator NtrX